MKLTKFNDINKFLKLTKPILLENEVENNLILGVCLHIQSNPERYAEKYLSIVVEENEVLAIAVCTPPFKLLLWCPLKDNDELIGLLLDDLLQSELIISGVLTENKLARDFIEVWQKRTGQTVKPGMSERIYQLEEVSFPKRHSGSMRLAEKNDLNLICKWMQEFHEEAIPNDPLNYFTEFATKKIDSEDLVIWEDKGKVVSLASRARPTINGICINLVYTPKKFRKKGYATALVAHLSQSLLNENWKYITLFTNLSNPTSNSIYQKVGFKPVCDFQEYIFKIEI